MGGGAGAGAAGTSGAVALVSCPTLPGATASPLYSVTVNGAPLFVEQMTKFSPEMQVHYAHGSLSASGTATIAVTVKQSFSAYTISPKSRGLAASKSGNTLTFASGPNYLILKFDSLDLLFILLDAPESNPPKLGDANVKNIADYSVDNTGATLMTSKIQSAINAASTSTQNILYFPPGKYEVGELWMKSNVTMYLACGAELYGSSNTGDFNTGSGGINIEGAQHGLVRMYQIQNAKILGRGTLDSNGHYIRGQNLDANLLKIEQSSNILVDGIVSVDSSYWNTLVYRSDQVTIQNYKVVNCRPSAVGGYNQTDGVDFVESTNGLLENAFLYTGDDGMAPKNEDANGVINLKNITHQHIVVYNNSVGCKIGTNSVGQSIDGITFDDIDIVRAGRAMTIEAYDTAVVSNATFSNIRVEAADSMLINLALDMPPTWRTAADTGMYKDTYFTNVSSDVKQVISLHGESSTVDIVGVHFKNLSVQGKAVTSQTDTDASWDINQYVSGITFQ
jgi:polygalacturonase